ncbi:MAG: alkaline phosphatase family protein [Planctomycetota bacterium]
MKRRTALFGALPVLALPALLPFVGAAPAAEPTASDAVGPKYPRLVVLGVDGFDPDILRDVVERFPERTENLRWLIEQSGIHELGTSQPPQSPVAWSNFITGLDPGGHGIFDFIHRDPATRGPAPSTTRLGSSSLFGLIPGGLESNRSGESWWQILADHGVPADVWRMPINFPVEESDGWAFPGMMTPAIDSAYGEAALFTTDASARTRIGYEKIADTISEKGGVIETELVGPATGELDENDEPVHMTLPMTFYVDREAGEHGCVAIELASTVTVLEPGQWSEWVSVDFNDGLMDSVEEALGMQPDQSGIVRFYLRSIDPEVGIYVSPINIDPRKPREPVSAPAEASAELADAIGTYYTQGMAEDVNALKNEILTDAEFLSQTNLVYRERRRMMDAAFDRYVAKPEGGVLFFYYSTVDLMCHMLWRHTDPDHPMYDAAMAVDDTSWWSGREGSQWKDVVHDIYLRIEPVIADIRERMDATGEPWDLILLSDHGFAPYERKFSLNTWLYENGYLVLGEREVRDEDGEVVKGPDGKPVMEKFDREREGERLSKVDKRSIYLPNVVDWSRTRAYNIGFNGLYLNLAGREGVAEHGHDGAPGIVKPDEAAALLAEIKAKLEAEVDPKTGRHPVRRADIATSFYENQGRIADAPDILVGFDYGYGNSDESSLGRVTHDVLTDNTGGTFNGSHLMCPDVVGGILLSNKKVRPGEHRLQDVTVEVLAHYGIAPTPEMKGHRVLED